MHAFASAGNLLVLKDGRLGFIDFGIVGKISPVTFQAMEAFLMSTMTADYNTMARALITMGVTQEQVVIEVKPFTSLHSFPFTYPSPPPPFPPRPAPPHMLHAILKQTPWLVHMLGIVLDTAALASLKCATDSIYCDFLTSDCQNRMPDMEVLWTF